MIDRPAINFFTLLSAHSANSPDKVAFRTEVAAVSWGDFELKTNRLANALHRAGIGHGDKVAALVGNSVDGVLLFFATLKAGAIYVPVSSFLSPDQMTTVVRDAEASMLFVSEEYRVQADVARESQVSPLDGCRRVSTDFDGDGWTSLASLTEGVRDAPVTVTARPEDIACLWYSSGTTGMPKGVMRSFHSLESMGLVTAIELEVGQTSVFYVGTPLTSSGSWIGILATLLTGATLILPRKFTTQGFLRAVAHEHVSHVGVVPTMLTMALEDPTLDETDFSRVKGIFSVGSKLHESVRADVARRMSGRIFEMYGLTEGFGTVSTPADEVAKPGTVGRPLLGAELRIIDADDKEVPPDVPGEIVGRGPLMMAGYYKRPDETRKVVWRDDAGRTFLRSGDIGCKDRDGYLFILDRKKDMIISGGLNVYPTDLEGVLKKHPDLVDLVVIGVPHQKWGEVPVALVKKREQSDLWPDQLKEWANAQLAKHQRVHEVHFWDRFHRNGFGKLIKHQIRDEFLAAR